MMTDEKIFKFNDENLAEAIVDEVPKDMEETVDEAIDACPVDAIEEVKEEKE
jgi:ferredoxin